MNIVLLLTEIYKHVTYFTELIFSTFELTFINIIAKTHLYL